MTGAALDRARLVRVLRILGSAHDGEVAAAGSAAGGEILLRGPPPWRRKRRPSGQEIGAFSQQQCQTGYTELNRLAQSRARLSLTTGSAPLSTCASGGVCDAADVAPSGQ
jgi:hypothetical protein